MSTTPPLTSPPDIQDRTNEIRIYAWDWFKLHAMQRTTMFNYFVAASGFLLAAFAAAAKDGLQWVASVIAVLGTLISVCFIVLDGRNARLVELGEERLRDVETELFGHNKLGMITEDRKTRDSDGWGCFREGRHKIFLRGVEYLIGMTFLLGAGSMFLAPSIWAPTKVGLESQMSELTKRTHSDLGALGANLETLTTSVGQVNKRLGDLSMPPPPAGSSENDAIHAPPKSQ